MPKPQKQHILAIDQGTTSSRALIFDAQLNVVGQGQHEFPQHFPQSGWVEHDPEDIWQSTLKSCEDALDSAGLQASDILSIGITNQRETTVVWDRESGEPIYRAIVWQDRRTADFCQQLKNKNLETQIQEKTGLLLDPYFSGTKIRWILENVEGAREQAKQGKLCFGTIDTFLLWRLTHGESFATDASNASRTLLMNLETCDWDNELLDIFDIPKNCLPKICNTADNFGVTHSKLLGAEIPIYSMVGDQQGALMGQACLQPGEAKSTYGTGCFALVNSGDKPLVSKNRLLSTVAWRIQGETTYAIEGSIFMAGAIMQWLRDKLGILQKASDSEQLAQNVPWQQSEILVPAFTGLGAPYWDPHARAAILGMTRDTGKEQIAAAGLRSVALQTQDLMRAMTEDGQTIETLKVDGGMTENQWFLQAVADITGKTVKRAANVEISIRGAAFLAGFQAGLFNDLQDIYGLVEHDQDLGPHMSTEERERQYQRWLEAVAKVR
ncbi:MULTISPECIES: glycerol kinase GlpK [Gammaproteobacteria]|uniref:glycerol kinase GlpK n=1 Tax=Gammaproteobacteria TaxID=1236 RepID=UPI000DCF8B05|nr:MULTISPECIES: glycerol kinase GlpK [Gammaproteobacteria]RTE86550.1 glycerol kinase [Aliidiomarina sp. B3213]TCZ90895.1 glycerol kinase [Lysobacter sp. N42]